MDNLLDWCRNNPAHAALLTNVAEPAMSLLPAPSPGDTGSAPRTPAHTIAPYTTACFETPPASADEAAGEVTTAAPTAVVDEPMDCESTNEPTQQSTGVLLIDLETEISTNAATIALAKKQAEEEAWRIRREEEKLRVDAIKVAEEKAERERKLAAEKAEIERRAECEKRAAAAESRKPWFGPATRNNVLGPIEVSVELPRRPYVSTATSTAAGENASLPAPVPLSIDDRVTTERSETGEEVVTSLTITQISDSATDENSQAAYERQGAIPKRRIVRYASSEEQESLRAQEELDMYLQTDSRMVRVEPTRRGPPPLRLLPIEAGSINEPMAWAVGDDEEESSPPAANDPLPSTSYGQNTVPSTQLQRSKKRKNTDLSRRQPQLDDYVSARFPSPPPMEMLGPADLVDRNPPRQSDPPVRRAEPPVRRAEPPVRQSPLDYPIRYSGVMFGDLTPIRTDPEVDPPTHSCFQCWGRDHIRTRCPQPRRWTYCFNCGRKGEDLSSCPRCSAPHRQYIETQFNSARPNSRSADARTDVRDRALSRPNRGEASYSRNVPERSTDRATPYERRDRREDRPRGQGFEQEPSRPRVLPIEYPQPTNVRDRLGPRVNEEPPARASTLARVGLARQTISRDTVLEALAIIDGISDLPAETRIGVLRHVYPHNDEPRRRN